MISLNKVPHCPECDSSSVLLDSMCAWNGEYWEYESDIGNYFCQECESTITEDGLKWKSPATLVEVRNETDNIARG